MKKFDLAVSEIVDNIKTEWNLFYDDWDITSWRELLNAFGMNPADMKIAVYQMLMDYSNRHENEKDAQIYLTDSYELRTENGELISYRKLMNAVRKQLFN